MDEASELIHKHRATGVLVDTNLLVLFLVGIVNPSRIGSFKRTSRYNENDFKRLAGLIAQFQQLYVTPGIWAEVNNLTDLSGDELRLIRLQIRRLTELTLEHHRPGRTITSHRAFPRLGFTDASICELAERAILVLTDDLDLHIWLQDNGLDSLNFTWLRALK